jgi:hypothetical protein
MSRNLKGLRDIPMKWVVGYMTAVIIIVAIYGFSLPVIYNTSTTQPAVSGQVINNGNTNQNTQPKATETTTKAVQNVVNTVKDVICNPDYVVASYDPMAIAIKKPEEYCKTLCYKQFQTTSFKITNSDPVMETIMPAKCYCDINKCGQIVNEMNQTTNIQPAIYCPQASAYIQGATYDSGVLNVYILNNGKVPLSFIGILTYNDGNVERYPDTLNNVTAGDAKTFTMIGVSTNLESVTIQSKECTGIQDMLYSRNIRGMG